MAKLILRYPENLTEEQRHQLFKALEQFAKKPDCRYIMLPKSVTVNFILEGEVKDAVDEILVYEAKIEVKKKLKEVIKK